MLLIKYMLLVMFWVMGDTRFTSFEVHSLFMYIINIDFFNIILFYMEGGLLVVDYQLWMIDCYNQS